jgi:cytochrome c556
MRASTLVFVALASAIGLGSTAVLAESQAIKDRQQIMKDVGRATREPGGMLKGEMPFNLAAVQKSLNTYIDSAKTMPGLFPTDSKTGGDTEASPKIWTDTAGFNAAFAKFGSDATAALAAIKDEASFKAAFPGVLRNCGTCHESFRQKKG